MNKKRYGISFLWLLASLLFYFFAVLLYPLADEGNAIYRGTLTSRFPLRKEAASVWETEKEEEEPRDFCFWSSVGIESYQNENNGRSTEAKTIACYGNMTCYYWQASGLDITDRKGCLIDAQTALALFGTREAAGQEITREFTKEGKSETKTYIIRKVLDIEEQTVLFQEEEETFPFTMINLRIPESESADTYAQQFFITYGFSVRSINNGWKQLAGALSLLLFPAFLIIQAAAYAKGKKEILVYWKWGYTAALAVMAAICIWVLTDTLSLPADWIPTRWSDFSFFEEKIAQWRRSFELSLGISSEPGALQRGICSIQMIIYSGLALFSLKKSVILSKK